MTVACWSEIAARLALSCVSEFPVYLSLGVAAAITGF